jgi:diaminohydroxyphosphoribosylaminopyrimidine deaminase/5-amino-6-(5-phosphoribosylamino)uracil reductase
MTQRGARQAFQAKLRAKGVEVVQFDFLTPENVADYCYERGFLQVRHRGGGCCCCCDAVLLLCCCCAAAA